MKTMKLKNIISIFTGLVICFLAITSQSLETNATTTYRYYWRHDYNNSSLTSYYRYSLASYDTDSTSYQGRSIIDSNDMVRDYDTSVVRLSVGGTGFIIGDHVIATAGHCVFNQNQDKFMNFTIDIVDANNNVIDTISPLYAHVNEAFATATNYISDYDYALIYVEEDLSEYGMFKLGVARDAYVNMFNENPVTVSGFPQEYPSGYEGQPYGLRFKATGNLIRRYTSENVLAYYTDTAGGDSGGPVYVEESVSINGQSKEYKTVIGINCSEFSTRNFGTRVNSDLLRFYYVNDYKTA